MRKQINEQLVLFYTNLFPTKLNSCSNKSHIVTLGIGGNIGNVKQGFHKLFKMLNSDGRFSIISTSPILKNPPFGYLDQDDFKNAIIVVATDLSPHATLGAMQRYENRFKRKRSFKDAPRTLDIDMIFYDNKMINTKDLIIPHPHWYKRESVIIPLGLLP